MAQRRVLVAGGTSSIGRAIVMRLADRGDAILYSGRDARKAAHLHDVANAIFYQIDHLTVAGVRRLMQAARSQLGGLDALVIAVGALAVGRLGETSDKVWDSVLEANVTIPFRLAKAAFPILAEQGGSIVTVGSGTAVWPEVELGAYSVAKRALERMTQMFAVSGATSGISANCVHPGELAVDMEAVVGDSDFDIGQTPVPPLGRRTEPSDVAAAVDFLISKDASFCTGTALVIDGGLRAALRAHKVRQ